MKHMFYQLRLLVAEQLVMLALRISPKNSVLYDFMGRMYLQYGDREFGSRI